MLTSQHPPKDVRIYEREALSFIGGGHRVTIVYMGDDPPPSERNVAWIAVPKPSNRFLRVLSGWKIAAAARRISDADIFIIHDAEILYIAVFLCLITSAAIIYDSHESSPHFISDKRWVHPFLKGIVYRVVLVYEWFFSLFCDGIITVYDMVMERFLRWGRNSVMVRNFPPSAGFPVARWDERAKKIIYVGLVSHKRQLAKMCAVAKALPEYNMEIWGPTYENTYVKDVTDKYSDVPNLSVDIGRISYSMALEKIAEARFGLVFLTARSAHRHTLSSKIFDYMMVGTIPLATDIEPNRHYLENGKYGFLIPESSGGDEIAKLISEKMKDPDSLEKMSEECRTKALNDYCWEREAETLVKFVEKIGERTKR